jgi:RNA-directed DNA polymerase
VLASRRSATWILEGDIRACFDEISHSWLLAHVPLDKPILRAWLKAGYWEKGQLFPTSAGTPQGGRISPLLSNLALDGMEQAVKAVTTQGDKVNFVRYADDFVVTGATRELLEQKVKPALTGFLAPRGLELSEQKTVITSIDLGFDFLGHTLRKHRGKLLITPAKSKVKILRQKIKQRVQSALALPQEALLRQLNPLLRGWANYYRNGVAKRTFKQLDRYVYWTIWRWVTRRHPTQSVGWKKSKYFSAAGPKGLLSVRVQRRGGESRVLTLYPLASTKIERHIKVRGMANPFDPQYTEYFARRRCFAWRVRSVCSHTHNG